MTQKVRQQESIIDGSTAINFNLQLSIIRKIMARFGGYRKQMVQKDIVYLISMFVFHNPLRLKYRPYSLHNKATLGLNVKYMLGRKLYNEASNREQKKADQLQDQFKYSSYLTITHQWKAISVPNENYNQIIVYGKNFIQFISRFKITPINYTQKDQIDPLVNFKAYQKQQKLKSLQHCLIGDNLMQIHQQIQILMAYDNDRKINDNVIHSFTNLMNKNIAVVKIQQNFQCKALGCQGKFLYFQNRSKLPLTQYKEIRFVEEFPWLQVNEQKNWKLCSKKYIGVNIYKGQRYPFGRNKATFLVNTKLEYFLQKDVWIQI